MGIIIILETIVIISLVVIVSILVNMLKKEKETFFKEQRIEKKTESFEQYNRLIPVELFQVLGMKSLSDITLKEQKELSATIMSINVSSFSEISKKLHPRETYDFINQILTECIPIIYDNDGVVTTFQEAGCTSIFTNYYENALNAAISIRERVIQMQKEEYKKLSIGISYGTVLVGLVGHKRRIAPLTLSDYTRLAQYLQEISDKYYTKIVITGSFADCINDFSKKFNYRFLGYLQIKNKNIVEKIYDIFDGEEVKIRNQKRKTRIVFEKGVTLFSEGNYKEARMHFIEVLKTDSMDCAAKEYVFLCEKYDSNIQEEKSIFFAAY